MQEHDATHRNCKEHSANNTGDFQLHMIQLESVI